VGGLPEEIGKQGTPNLYCPSIVHNTKTQRHTNVLTKRHEKKTKTRTAERRKKKPEDIMQSMANPRLVLKKK